MARQPRLQVAGMYHVMTRAVANSWLFVEDDDYRTRLALLAEEAERRSMRLHAYCLMGNHEHLLLTVEDDDRLARLMQRLNRRYAGTFNRKHRRRGRVYGSPYESKPVISNRHLIELIRYLALNPEQVDLGHAETYPWSSYPSLIGVIERPWFLDPQPLLDAVGGRPDAREIILRLVDDGRLRRRAA